MRTTVPSVRTIVFICALLFSFKSFSQSIIFGGRNEIGVAIGPSFFLGDLGGNMGADLSGSTAGGLKHLNLPLTKLAKGAFLAVYPKSYLGFRLGINHTVLSGDDAEIPAKESGDEQFRRYRNLNFKSSVVEAHLLAEIYPLGFVSDEETNGFKPYVLVGVGAFKFNPKARVGNEWVALQPLMLEGQGMEEYPERKKYSLIGKSANVGVGFKYYFGGNKFVGAEMLYRSPKGANKDYIDDVSTTYIDANLFDKYLPANHAAIARSLYFREAELATGVTRPGRSEPQIGEQRGDPREGDSFFTSIIRFGWVLPDPNSPSGRQARQMRCPSFY